MAEPIQIGVPITSWDVGDILAGSSQGRAVRVPGSTSADLKVFAQKGDGKKSSVPFWTSVGAIIPGLAAIATSGSASDLIAGTIPPLRFPALTGDVTNPAGSLATTISANAVSNGKLAKMPPMTIKGNNSILASDPKDLTVADLNAMGIGGGGGGGSGTVTSVGLSLPAIFNVAGSPVTTAGTFTVTLATELANTAWMGPASGAAATPTFRGLVLADIPSLATLYQPIDATLTALSGLADAVGFLHNDGAGVLAWAAGGTGTVAGTGTDNHLMRWDGTTNAQDSGSVLDDNGNLVVTSSSTGDVIPLTIRSNPGGTGTRNNLNLDNTHGAGNFKSQIGFLGGGALKWAMGNDSTETGADDFWIYQDSVSDFRFQIKSTGLLRLKAYGAGVLTSDASGNITSTAAGSGDFVGPASATDNAAVRFDTTTGKLGQNSLFIIDDSGNVSDGGTLPASTALYFERSSFCIATLNSTAAESRLRMKRADTLNSVWLEFQRNDASNEWLLGVPNSGVIAGGNTFAIDYYDGTTEFAFLQLSNAGALRLPAYGAGFLQTDASGNVTAGAGGGSGTVNSGTATQLAYYATTGTAVSSTPAFTIGASGDPSITAQGSNQNITLTPSGTGYLQSAKKVYFGDAIDPAASARDFNIISTSGGICLIRTGSASPFVELISRATATGSDIAYWDFYANSNSSNLDDLTIRSRAGTNDNVMRFTKTVASVLTTTDSSSTTTGALQSSGGLGVAKKSFFGDELTVKTPGAGGVSIDAASSSAMLQMYLATVRKAIVGVSGGTDFINTGSVSGDICLRTAGNMVFSTDDGTTVAMKIVASTAAISFPQIPLTTGLSIAIATKSFPLTINGTVVNVLCQ